MLWIVFATASYFFSATSLLFDRFLLVGPMKNPALYAFYAGIAGIGMVLILPFVDLARLTPEILLIALIAGILNTYALIVFFTLVSRAEVTRAAPVVGSIQILFVPLLSFMFLGEAMKIFWQDVMAFSFLFVGSFFMMQKKMSFTFPRTKLTLIFISSFLNALTIVLTKIVFLSLPFILAIAIMSIGGGIGALTLLTFPQVRNELFERPKILGQKLIIPFLTGRSASLIGSILYMLAVYVATVPRVSIIGAMVGLQYVFLYTMAYLVGLRRPELLKEDITGPAMLQKIFAGTLVLIGTVMIFLS